jgi:DNA (cytosine-5)-methyltransferase 1
LVANPSAGLEFIDLFAGLGGFHLALEQLGHRCVFASELNSELQVIYAKNFGLTPDGDIRQVPVKTIPTHEILCAGFPCQPFSKAGGQDGFDCPSWGDLFDRVVAIIKHHKPEYLLLENVPNLLKHNGGKTWNRVLSLLKAAGYESDARILSPHQFGVPQIRERVYIVARRGGLRGFNWPERELHPNLHVNSVLESSPADAKLLSQQVIDCLEMWQRFIRRFPKKEHLPTFPVWAMEFGANYPYEKFAPASIKRSQLRKYRGAYGKALKNVPDDQLFAALPPYARSDNKAFPDWKIDFIRKNRQLYQKNKKWIDDWKDELLAFPPSLQKLEWNCKGGERDIWKYVIQFRASGVRVKRPTTAPSLIAMTVTQVPIIAWERRYMTPRECARLQSMESLKILPQASTPAYKALGNAINVHVMRLIAQALVRNEHPEKSAIGIQLHRGRTCAQVAAAR